MNPSIRLLASLSLDGKLSSQRDQNLLLLAGFSSLLPNHLLSDLKIWKKEAPKNICFGPTRKIIKDLEKNPGPRWVIGSPTLNQTLLARGWIHSIYLHWSPVLAAKKSPANLTPPFFLSKIHRLNFQLDKWCANTSGVTATYVFKNSVSK